MEKMSNKKSSLQRETNGPVGEEDHRRSAFSSQEEFVRALNGVRLIKRILIANNGIAAVKCMRSIRSWAYATFRNAEAFFFVCMASPEDVNANAEYIKMANKMVMVPGGSNPNNYANVELIFQTAISNHVDAVWAGWGHASENPQLPEILSKHNIAFLGPSHEAMWALGDKIASTILAQSAGIPTVPWSGSHIVVCTGDRNTDSKLSTSIAPDQRPLHAQLDCVTTVRSESNPHSLSTIISSSDVSASPVQLISPKDFADACVTTADGCLDVCNKIGYPVMIKASEGGGGKGIRRATNANEVPGFFTQVQNEVPESPIFVMKCVQHVRHLEVQLLADQYGEAISLFGRDCSVQRRHQKILEEAPVVVAPPDIFDAMEKAAIRLAKLVGYTSAGTVEYLYNTETREFFFLELNPRLQVEHPCTEVVSGVNLPACQLQIAMGIPLVRIRDIRNLFGLAQSNDYSISLSQHLSLRRPPSSHVIAVRVTSEDPDEGFKPRSGDVFELNFKSSRSVWGYFSVGTVGGIHEFADSQFGHCFSTEVSREQARENMVLALRELLIRGDFRTTVEYLIKILESDAYIFNEIDTEWLDRLIAQKDRPVKPDICLGVMCTALHIAFRALEQAHQNFEVHFERGQFFPTNKLSNCVDVTLISDGVKYVVQVVRTGKTSFHLITNGGLQATEVHRMSGDGLLITHESFTYMTYCREDGQGYQTVIDNRTVVFSKEWDLSILRSPSPGKLVQFTVVDGSHVFDNEVYALVEVMKLVLELRAPASGCIFHLRCAGAILECGTPLARLQLDDPKKCQTLELFTGQLIPLHAQTQDMLSVIDGPAMSLSSGVASDDCPIIPAAFGEDASGNDWTDVGDTESISLNGAGHHGNPHRTFLRCLSELEDVLAGYALPEPFFSEWVETKLDELFHCLRDPKLPLLELEDAIAQLSSRLPSTLEQSLSALADAYSNEITSMLSNFPADKIIRLVEGYIAARRLEFSGEPNATTEAGISTFQQTVKGIIDLADRYRGGVRGHAARTIATLLLAYVAVEQHYQHGQFDRCVNLLLTRHKESSANKGAGSGSGAGGETAPSPRRKTADILPVISWSLPDSVQRLADPLSVADVVSVHFSHHQLFAKNALLVGLIDRLHQQREITVTRDLLESLNALTQLGAAANSKVALAARKYLIATQSPPYELRRNQVESIMLSAVNHYDEHLPMESMQKLITSETAVFDILLDFFYHPNPMIVNAALETYVRRSYITYELMGLQHFQLTPNIPSIFFRFLLPNASMHINLLKHFIASRKSFVSENKDVRQVASTDSFNSIDDIGLDWLPSTDCQKLMELGYDPNFSLITSNAGIDEAVHRTASSSWVPDLEAHDRRLYLKDMSSRERLGAISIFKSFDEFKSAFPTLISRFQHKLKVIQMEKRAGGRRQSSFSATQTSRLPSNNSIASAETLSSIQDAPQLRANSQAEDPMNVLNIGIRASCLTSMCVEDLSEEADVHVLEEFCSNNENLFKLVGIRRITFMLVISHRFPIFYTFRARDKFREDRVYRHLEPALAFQMEINRLRKYDLELVPVLNHRMHIYLGQAKIPQGQGAVDFRFFVRCMIRHTDLVSTAASFEYLRSEAERTLLESMDALEVAFTHPKANFTTGNHIFLNFAPTLLLEDTTQLHFTVRKTILRYATRLIKLRVNQAELKLMIRRSASGPRIPIRLFISNDQSFSLKLEIYREVPNFTTGAVHLVSYGSRVGNLHGCLANAPYETKNFLQLKRFQAQKFGSTYVYDYPSIFGQVLQEAMEIYKPHEVVFSIDGDSNNSRTERQSTKKSVSKALLENDMRGRAMNDFILECKELCLDNSGQLVHVERPAGLNKVGMVVWEMRMRTPEYPEGRPVIIIANDVTHKAGSFGPTEDLLYFRASEMARKRGIPRIFLAANSGARIRLADDVKALFKVAWIDSAQPDKGFKYLYLSESDYEKLSAIKAINCELIECSGEKHYKIIDIIGKDFDISAENLRGSAMIAGETAAAYEECFTISVVTSRTIGIGAYVVRLGQRVIQVENSHIILTGAMALNKLLGREVYTSNSQLGGVQVMANNGVCHAVTPDEYSALQQVVSWLSFVPYQRGAALPLLHRPVPSSIATQLMASSGSSPTDVTRSRTVQLPSKPQADIVRTDVYFDPVDRSVDYLPSRERPSDDPRWMFTGVLSGQLQTTTGVMGEVTESSPSGGSRSSSTSSTCGGGGGGGGGRWLSGFFDWGTWEESLAAWAAGVVVGRARLGGLPCGVITPETRVSVSQVPADPANPASEAQTINQAGQVWYPDSSYKTAQAIADFAREGLPLFIFANWRGFSGGLKDMYDQVLKFGAMIVESLRTYPSPVFVYLPPHSELRGGAWVVIDPAINPDCMEFFCTPDTCRAGVLEPEGTVEIKYRKPELLATINRLDDECCRLTEEIKIRQSARHTALPTDLSSTVTANPVSLKALQDRLVARQKLLLPIYQQVAHRFADLHDTPGRLVARGLVHATVAWNASRGFFFAHLSRRLLEQDAVRLLRCAQNPLQTDAVRISDSTSGLLDSEPDLSRGDEALLLKPRGLKLRYRLTSACERSSDDPCPRPLQPNPDSDSTSLRGDLLSDAERACHLISQIGAQRSASIRRDLTLLRQWFLLDMSRCELPDVSCVTLPSSPTAQRTSGVSSSVPLLNLASGQLQQSPATTAEALRAWEFCDTTVAYWLAVQLEHSQLRQLLLPECFNPPSLVNGCWVYRSLDSPPCKEIISSVSPVSSLLSRLDRIANEKIVNHIRRLLLSHPDCISEALECVQRLHGTHNSTSSAAAASVGGSAQCGIAPAAALTPRASPL